MKRQLCEINVNHKKTTTNSYSNECTQTPHIYYNGQQNVIF